MNDRDGYNELTLSAKRNKYRESIIIGIDSFCEVRFLSFEIDLEEGEK